MGEEINFVELDHPITQDSLCYKNYVSLFAHELEPALKHKLKGGNASS